MRETLGGVGHYQQELLRVSFLPRESTWTSICLMSYERRILGRLVLLVVGFHDFWLVFLHDVCWMAATTVMGRLCGNGCLMLLARKLCNGLVMMKLV